MDTDTLTKKSGGGWLALLGLPFFLVGCFALGATLTGQLKREDGQPQGVLLGGLISSVFIAVGAGFLFGRGGAVIDRRNGTVMTWWGLLVPFRRKVRPLDGFQYVTLTREVVKTDKGSRTIYPVRMVGGEDKITWKTANSVTKGRQAAENLAKFLDFELRDSTSGKTVIRKAKHLDESVADRARRLGEQIDWPELPAASEIEYETVGDSAVIRLPPTKPNALAFVVPVLIAIMFVFFFLPFFSMPAFGDSAGMPVGMKILMVAFAAAFAGAIVIAFGLPLLRMGARDTITASWEGIEVNRRFRVGSRRWHIPANELEELEVGGGGRGSGRGPGTGVDSPGAQKIIQVLAFLSRRYAVHARSDRLSVSFGPGLSQEEQKWLHGALKYILVNRPR